MVHLAADNPESRRRCVAGELNRFGCKVIGAICKIRRRQHSFLQLRRTEAQAFHLLSFCLRACQRWKVPTTDRRNSSFRCDTMSKQVMSGPIITKAHLPAIDAGLIEMFACRKEQREGERKRLGKIPGFDNAGLLQHFTDGHGRGGRCAGAAQSCMEGRCFRCLISAEQVRKHQAPAREPGAALMSYGPRSCGSHGL